MHRWAVREAGAGITFHVDVKEGGQCGVLGVTQRCSCPAPTRVCESGHGCEWERKQTTSHTVRVTGVLEMLKAPRQVPSLYK